MSEQFVKGYTNNHLVWAMVDATDFATPESALSAATKIKIYGKVKGGTGVNFVSSGTGSLTNDIQHVGASVLGIYTIALAKADLSDASAAWYDKYIISLSATGAAYQVLVADGGIWISDLSAIASDIRSDVSDLHSDVLVMSGILSDAMSMLTAQSDAISNVYSAVIAVNASNLSDIASAVWANTIGARVDSRLRLVQSDTSDLASRITGAVATSSDVASAVWADTIGARVDSRILVAQSYLSDIRSDVSDMHSDLLVMSGILSDAYSAATAIKAKTDSITFTVAGQVDANVQFVNDVAVTGTGAVGDEWGP